MTHVLCYYVFYILSQFILDSDFYVFRTFQKLYLFDRKCQRRRL